MSSQSARTSNYELAGASILTGILGAAVIYLTESEVGLEAFAPLAQLWTFWALCAASITFSTQQWTIRSLGQGHAPITIAASIWTFVAIVAVGLGALAWMFSDQWFEGQVKYPVLVTLVVLGTGANGFARGTAAAAGATRILAMLVLGENAIRIVALVPLMAIDADPIWFGVVLLAGFGINVLTIGRHKPTSTSDFSTARGLSTMTIMGLVGLLGYVTMFGGPLFLGLANLGSAEVSAFFLVLTLARVPFVIMLGLLPQVAVRLENLAATDQYDLLTTWRNRVVVASVGSAAVVGLTAWLIADKTLGRVLGTNPYFGSQVFALVGAASVVSLGVLLLTMARVARAQHRWLILVWSTPILTMILALSTSQITSVLRLSKGLMVMELFLLFALAGLHKPE